MIMFVCEQLFESKFKIPNLRSSGYLPYENTEAIITRGIKQENKHILKQKYKFGR